MHALLDVLTLHRMRVIAKSKVNCERSFKCYFNTPHTDYYIQYYDNNENYIQY